MAGRGPAPQGKRSRKRDEARDQAQGAELVLGAAPAKARPLPGARSRHARTRRWWKVAAGSPQAALFLETDWLVMERLADLYDAFFGGATSVASEIRLCEAKLGFTPEDRLRLRWRLAEAKGDEPAGDVPVEAGGPAVDPRLRFVKGGAA